MSHRHLFCSTSLIALSLAGCLNTADERESGPNPQSISSLSSSDNCNPGKEGTVRFDSHEKTLYACDGKTWIAINLKGDKGERGEAGEPGPKGDVGPQGEPGLNGTNGRNGIDGSGVRMALMDNGVVRGVLIEFSKEHVGAALMMIPNKDLIHIDVGSGKFTGKPWQVYFDDPGCTGVAHAGRNDSPGPHVVGRIYVGPGNSGSPEVFFRGEEWVDQSRPYRSFLDFSTYGQMNTCVERVGTFRSLMRVEKIPAPTSLQHLAPIRFDP